VLCATLGVSIVADKEGSLKTALDLMCVALHDVHDVSCRLCVPVLY